MASVNQGLLGAADGEFDQLGADLAQAPDRYYFNRRALRLKRHPLGGVLDFLPDIGDIFCMGYLAGYARSAAKSVMIICDQTAATTSCLHFFW